MMQLIHSHFLSVFKDATLSSGEPPDPEVREISGNASRPSDLSFLHHSLLWSAARPALCSRNLSASLTEITGVVDPSRTSVSSRGELYIRLQNRSDFDTVLNLTVGRVPGLTPDASHASGLEDTHSQL
jgi:hypothetical protein